MDRPIGTSTGSTKSDSVEKILNQKIVPCPDSIDIAETKERENLKCNADILTERSNRVNSEDVETSITEEKDTHVKVAIDNVNQETGLTTLSLGSSESSEKMISVPEASLNSLIHHQCLDDEIMNSYMNIVRIRLSSPDSAIFILSTFFYTQFRTCVTAEEKIKRVLKFFSKCESERPLTTLSIPFYLPTRHWTLGVIRLNQKRFEYYDRCFGDYDPDEFDPLLIMKYVMETLITCENSRLQKAIGLLKCDTDFSTWDYKQGEEIEIGRQTNIVDCGVFVCTDVYSIVSNGHPSKTSMNEVVEIRRRMHAEILKYTSPPKFGVVNLLDDV